MATKKYNLGCSDYFGCNDEASEIFNTKLIPYLKKNGIREEKTLDEIFSIVREITSAASITASENREMEINEYS
jgi:hypothetical protein